MQTQKLIHFQIQIQKRGAQKTWSKIGQETVFLDLSNSVRKLGGVGGAKIGIKFRFFAVSRYFLY